MNSQSESVESLGTWKAGLSSHISCKDPVAMSNMSAVTIYRVVTVKVNKYYY